MALAKESDSWFLSFLHALCRFLMSVFCFCICLLHFWRRFFAINEGRQHPEIFPVFEVCPVFKPCFRNFTGAKVANLRFRSIREAPLFFGSLLGRLRVFPHLNPGMILPNLSLMGIICPPISSFWQAPPPFLGDFSLISPFSYHRIYIGWVEFLSYYAIRTNGCNLRC